MSLMIGILAAFGLAAVLAIGLVLAASLMFGWMSDGPEDLD